jgi:bacterioferritin
MDNKSINELNTFLKGEYMAIDSYEKFIEKANSPTVKAELQRIQQEHKHHAASISERIQNLGGHPVNGIDVKGKLAATVFNIKNIKNQTDTDIITEAYKGEDMGIRAGAQTVEGKLDNESMSLIGGIIDEDKTHLNELRNLSNQV